jgi:hypothetical protein
MIGGETDCGGWIVGGGVAGDGAGGEVGEGVLARAFLGFDGAGALAEALAIST